MQLPRVRAWWGRVALINAIQIGIIILAGLTWNHWLAKWSLVRLDGRMSDWAQGLIAYFISTFVYYWWHSIRHESRLWQALGVCGCAGGFRAETGRVIQATECGTYPVSQTTDSGAARSRHTLCRETNVELFSATTPRAKSRRVVSRFAKLHPNGNISFPALCRNSPRMPYFSCLAAGRCVAWQSHPATLRISTSALHLVSKRIERRDRTSHTRCHKRQYQWLATMQSARCGLFLL